MSSLAGVLVAWGSAEALEHVAVVREIFGDGGQRAKAVILFGFLSAGGSGLWNSVATYANKIKDLTEERVQRERVRVRLAERRLRGLQDPGK